MYAYSPEVRDRFSLCCLCSLSVWKPASQLLPGEMQEVLRNQSKSAKICTQSMHPRQDIDFPPLLLELRAGSRSNDTLSWVERVKAKLFGVCSSLRSREWLGQDEWERERNTCLYQLLFHLFQKAWRSHLQPLKKHFLSSFPSTSITAVASGTCDFCLDAHLIQNLIKDQTNKQERLKLCNKSNSVYKVGTLIYEKEQSGCLKT